MGIHQNVEEEGAAAVDHVVALMQRNETGIPSAPRAWMIGARWVDAGAARKNP